MQKKYIINNVALETPFRGERTYIQSSTIYNELLKYCQNSIDDNAWVRQLKLVNFFHTQCYITECVDGDSEVVGSFSVVCSAQVLNGFIVTKGGNEITEREIFDETLICHGSRILDNGIMNQWNESISFIDQCVTLTKHFHNQLYKLDSKKWIYTRITLTEDVNNIQSEEISIMLSKKLGDRMTQSYIFLDGNQCGTIDFSVSL